MKTRFYYLGCLHSVWHRLLICVLHKKVVFVAGPKIMAFLLMNMPQDVSCWPASRSPPWGIKAVVVTDGGYPKDPTVFDGADAVVVACDGGSPSA